MKKNNAISNILPFLKIFCKENRVFRGTTRWVFYWVFKFEQSGSESLSYSFFSGRCAFWTVPDAGFFAQIQMNLTVVYREIQFFNLINRFRSPAWLNCKMYRVGVPPPSCLQLMADVQFFYTELLCLFCMPYHLA